MNFLKKLLGTKPVELPQTVDANPTEVVIEAITAEDLLANVVGSDWGKIQNIIEMQSGSRVNLSVTFTVTMDVDRAKALLNLVLEKNLTES